MLISFSFFFSFFGLSMCRSDGFDLNAPVFLFCTCGRVIKRWYLWFKSNTLWISRISLECDEEGNGKYLFLETIMYHVLWIFRGVFFQILINFGMNLSRERKMIFFFFLFFYRSRKDTVGIVSCLVEINVHMVCANISFNGKTRETSGSNYCINTYRRVFRIP